MRVRVLGTTSIEVDGSTVPVAARRPRSILAALALTPGRAVSADRLLDLVWGDGAPPGALGTMHSYISGLRRAVEPDLAPRQRPSVLVTTDAGYCLRIDQEAVDAHSFARAVRERHAFLAPLWSQLTTGPDSTWPSRDDVGRHVEALDAALATWTGPAYVDLGDHPDVLAERAALDELRALGEEDTTLGLLALGEHATVVAAAEQSVARHPLRERTRCLHALALVRVGRQVEAIEALRSYRALLADELGLDPGPEVRDLESAVLRQDAALTRSLTPPALPAVGPGAPPEADDARAARSTAVPVGGWPTVGRETESRVVADVLEAAAAGTPGFALVVGDPGTGKSRLVEDAARVAAGRGITTAVGRCSQDDGAPPLWPWRALLDGLGVDHLDEPDIADDRSPSAERAFAVQDALVRAVRRRAADGPVLLVVEDLHWADTRTLRALAHLVASLRPGDRVCLLVTRRSRPTPSAGALADLGVTLLRHGARTVELGGLGPDDAAALVEAAGPGTSTERTLIEQWCAHTGGNPFFLVELARVAASPGGWRGEVPDSVQAVVARRLQELSDATRELLLVSAALGREHSPLLLTHVAGWAPAGVAEALEPAEEAGLVRQRPDGLLAFDHALTRDAVLATVSPAQVARTHARIAHALGSVPRGGLGDRERAFDLAHHWLAAGPLHASLAWPAAAAAAAEARREFANVEATDLYRAALDAHALDPAATRDQRYDLLLAYAESAAYSGLWRRGVEAVVEAIGLARADDDAARVAHAAAGLTRHSVWTPQEFDEVDEDLVDDLRATLARPAARDDPALRCVLMLALAVQLYYRWDAEPEVDALVDEGIALARRAGDAELRAWAAHAGGIALWRPSQLARRVALADEELAAAVECGDDATKALAHTTRAGLAVESGDLETWRSQSAEARSIAGRRRLAYIEYVLEFVDFSIAALAADHPATDRHLETLRSMQDGLATPALEWNDFGCVYALACWRPGYVHAVVGPMLDHLRANPFELGRYALLQLLALAGRLDDLREELARAPLEEPRDRWWMTSEGAALAVAAAALGDRDLARAAVDILRPATGRLAVNGISTVHGPVDGHLALALAVLGDREGAARQADLGDALARRWGMTAFLRQSAQDRERLGF